MLFCVSVCGGGGGGGMLVLNHFHCREFIREFFYNLQTPYQNWLWYLSLVSVGTIIINLTITFSSHCCWFLKKEKKKKLIQLGQAPFLLLFLFVQIVLLLYSVLTVSFSFTLIRECLHESAISILVLLSIVYCCCNSLYCNSYHN